MLASGTHKKDVLIIEDHAMTREGIKVVLSWAAGFGTIFEASTAKSGLDCIKQKQPGLAILDLALPDRNGLEIIKKIKALSPSTRILVLTMYTRGDLIRKAIGAGVHGYLSKDSPPENLLEAINRIEDGGYYFDQAVIDEIVKFITTRKETADEGDGNTADLSKRESEILRLIAEGLSVKEIAFRLSISSKTVENHRYRLMRKLKVSDSLGLVRFALKKGLFTVEEWLK